MMVELMGREVKVNNQRERDLVAVLRNKINMMQEDCDRLPLVYKNEVYEIAGAMNSLYFMGLIKDPVSSIEVGEYCGKVV